MINIDPDTGDTSGVALKVLAGYRRERANIFFGQFLARAPAAPTPANSNGVPTAMDKRINQEREEDAKYAAAVGVDGAGRVCGTVERNNNGISGAVNGWKAWVWEGMEVAGEA